METMFSSSVQSKPHQNAHQCYHCGDPCIETFRIEDKTFCCRGCQTVYEILEESKLGQFYHLGNELNPLRPRTWEMAEFDYLDDPEIQSELFQYHDDELAILSFSIPAIHCASCVWLLEKLPHVNTGVERSEVNFIQRRAHIHFLPKQISLKELVILLTSIGYPPDIHRISQKGNSLSPQTNRRLILDIGLAGFCAGNIMLLSFPEYLGLGHDSLSHFSHLLSYLNLLLALPLVLFSGRRFFQSAWRGIKYGNLNIDVPISIGIMALFLWSSFEILSNSGPGYIDSLASLIFLLLLGKWLQRKTYDRIAFEKDYTAYFPLSILKRESDDWVPVKIDKLQPDDEIRVRNGELIPADAYLLSDTARIDYRFVTGESRLVSIKAGEKVLAGGRLKGKSGEFKIQQSVSQSYLVRLWDQQVEEEEPEASKKFLIDRLSKSFTIIVLSIALLGGLFWGIKESLYQGIEVFTAVLIIACPCGLALTGPISLGNAMRYLGKAGLFVKSIHIVEKLSAISSIVFDKTGTLTEGEDQDLEVHFDNCSPEQARMVGGLAKLSSHPLSQAISKYFGSSDWLEFEDVQEYPGEGVSGIFQGQEVRIGSYNFLKGGTEPITAGSYWGIDEKVLGHGTLRSTYRPGLFSLLEGLRQKFSLSILSGDHASKEEEIAKVIPKGIPVYLEQKPHQKLEFIKNLQQTGEQVLMIGDGLNDSNALKQAEVGIAITHSTDAFSPACDAVLAERSFGQINSLLRYARASQMVVKIGLAISLMYNLVGLGFALSGHLSPLIAAILMPLSSIMVIVWGYLGTSFLAAKILGSDKSHPLSQHRSF